MTDAIDPMEEPLDEQSREALQRTQAKLIKQIEDSLDGGGKKTIRYRCQSCGSAGSIEVDMVDVEGSVKALSTVSAALAREKASDKGAETSAAAQKIIHDFSEMTTAELAEYAAKLREELRGE